MHICIYMHIYVMYMYICTFDGLSYQKWCLYTHTHSLTHSLTQRHIHTHTHSHTQTHAHTYTHTHTHHTHTCLSNNNNNQNFSKDVYLFPLFSTETLFFSLVFFSAPHFVQIKIESGSKLGITSKIITCAL